MSDDFENFVVAQGKTILGASIKTEWFDEHGFMPFVGGCGISGGMQKTAGAARQMIFEYLHGEIQLRIDDHKARIKELEVLQTKLGDDVFNLGQFKTA
jgi:hypothetical protein